MATVEVTNVVREFVDPIAVNQFNRVLGRVEKIFSGTRNYATRWSRLARTGQVSQDPRRDIRAECGHPNTADIDLDDYHEMYTRNPLARKVVNIVADHCWRVHPEVTENDDPNETAFEKAVKELGDKLRGQSWYQDDEGDPVFEYLHRVDRISGIGRYGALVIGVGGEEGKDLSQPLTLGANKKAMRELIYLKALPERQCKINTYEEDQSSPRYGLPSSYHVTFDDATLDEMETTTRAKPMMSDVVVDWTRVVHVVHEVTTNEVLHTPDMLPVYDRLLDVDKLYGSSAEMYYQGAFPGFSAETHPALGGDVSVDSSALRTQLEKYMNSMQRWLVTKGMLINQLSPQVVDPTPQINVQIEALAMHKGCPKRIFIGSERGELASSQDQEGWDKTVDALRNQDKTPNIVVPFFNRLILISVLPAPVGFSVKWPEIETLSPVDKAEIAVKVTQAIVAYINGNGEALLPVEYFLTVVLGFTQEEAESIIETIMAEEPSIIATGDQDQEGVQDEQAVDEMAGPDTETGGDDV